jgi:peptidoglycan/xylan/chitin deacetylase (PgdA/CDA1 family)
MTRKIACITVDMEADFLEPTGRIRLFEDEALLERFISVMQGGVKVTAFLVTSLIPKHGAALEGLENRIALEFAIHSHAHDMQNPCTPEDIQRATEAFRAFTGRAPLGYRAPVGMITREGLDTLMRLGFRYDSSIYPSARPGLWGYNYLHLPNAPFRITDNDRSLLEIPFGSLSGIRLNFSLSYVKLFGWKTYEMLLKLFPLPPQVSVLSHPHDYYFHLLKDDVNAREKPLLLRNARSAFDLLEKMIRYLRGAGYEFAFMSELCDALEVDALPSVPVDRVAKSRGPRRSAGEQAA